MGRCTENFKINIMDKSTFLLGVKAMLEKHPDWLADTQQAIMGGIQARLKDEQQKLSLQQQR